MIVSDRIPLFLQTPFAMSIPSSDPRGPASPNDAVGGGVSDALVLDPAALARLAELDPTGESRLLQRVLVAYQNGAARLMPQLEVARRAQDLDAVRYVAHTLKSSSGSIGAVKFSALCSEIEAMIRSKHTDGLEAGIDAMSGELDGVLTAVQHLLDAKQ